MKEEFPIHAAQFFTATIYDWQHVLADDTHKDIIIESMGISDHIQPYLDAQF